MTPTWQRTTCIFQWSLEREFMYFAGKLVYLIVRASNQLAVKTTAQGTSSGQRKFVIFFSANLLSKGLIYLMDNLSYSSVNFTALRDEIIGDLRTILVVYLSVPFLLKSSYTLLRMLKCLKLYAWNCMWGQDTPDFMKISSYTCNCIIFIIKVINYALWHTFESKRYMYFHNKTWYTCTHCYMQSPIWRVSIIIPF